MGYRWLPIGIFVNVTGEGAIGRIIRGIGAADNSRNLV